MNVQMTGLEKRFGQTLAVQDFTAELEDGKLFCLLGPSGCGKSTILNMLSGILKPSAGKILFDGEDVTSSPPERRGVGLVFQNYALYPHMSVLENICFPLEIKHIPKSERLERATKMAQMVHVDKLLSRKPRELSGGQQQRVAIARALVKEPCLLLLDEPLSNLDARLRLEMREEIRRIQLETQVTTVFVTHDQEEALSISDRIILMKDGFLQQQGEPLQIYREPENLFAADFLGNPPINHLNITLSEGRPCLEGGACAPESWPAFPEAPQSIPLILAVRPESAFITTEAPGAPGLVQSLFETGKETLAHVLVSGQPLRCYVEPEQGLKPGDAVFIRLKNRGVFLFDPQTGKRFK